MSDRFVLHATKQEIEQQLGVSSERDDFFEANYNISPGTLVPAVCMEEGRRQVYNFQWGLIPEGADEEEEGKEEYEAAVEELRENEWYMDCFRSRRCIIPANGFYKWKTTEKKNTPFYIRLLSNQVMGIAGIYSVWKSPSGRDVYSCCMLTTEANVLVQPVDDRMPVILRRDHYNEWLGDGEIDEATLKTMLKPYQLTEMAVTRVSEDVNDITSTGPELIQPIPK